MKFDVYISDGKARVYPRGEIVECGCLPSGEPLHVADEQGEWWDWCDRNGGRDNALRCDDFVRVCRLVGKFNAAFVEDLRIRAQSQLDAYRSEGADAGWGDLSIDRSGMSYTFRRSAAWKDEPILYTFSQSLKWSVGHSGPWSGEALRIRDRLVQLWGMADAVHELGIDIVFGEDFRIHVEGVHSEWSASYEC